MKYQFKYENYSDEWEDWDTRIFGKEPHTEERAAEIIAEYDFYQDQIDANNYEFKVEIKSDNGIKKFVVTADYSVDFYVKEVE